MKPVEFRPRVSETLTDLKAKIESLEGNSAQRVAEFFYLVKTGRYRSWAAIARELKKSPSQVTINKWLELYRAHGLDYLLASKSSNSRSGSSVHGRDAALLPFPISGEGIDGAIAQIAQKALECERSHDTHGKNALLRSIVALLVIKRVSTGCSRRKVQSELGINPATFKKWQGSLEEIFRSLEIEALRGFAEELSEKRKGRHFGDASPLIDEARKILDNLRQSHDQS